MPNIPLNKTIVIAVQRRERNRVTPMLTRKITTPKAMNKGQGIGDSVNGWPWLLPRNQKLIMVPRPASTITPS
jgi:hypothetical protein